MQHCTLTYSRHAETRMQQRCVRRSDVQQIVDDPDLEVDVGSGLVACSFGRSQSRRRRSAHPGAGSLCNVAVVLDPATATIVTVLRGAGRRGARYLGHRRRR